MLYHFRNQISTRIAIFSVRVLFLKSGDTGASLSYARNDKYREERKHEELRIERINNREDKVKEKREERRE